MRACHDRPLFVPDVHDPVVAMHEPSVLLNRSPHQPFLPHGQTVGFSAEPITDDRDDGGFRPPTTQTLSAKYLAVLDAVLASLE